MISEEQRRYIEETVHHLYYEYDMNCARTTLTCLGRLCDVEIQPQTMVSAIGLHGAGGFRAQCGLVEGALMFIGVYFTELGLSVEEVVKICYDFAEQFTAKFGSLICRELRPWGFNPDDEPHMCEGLTCRSIEFSYEYVMAVKESHCR